MNQDDPGETWDSFESADFYEHLNNGQAHAETAASSTTRSNPPKWTGKRFILFFFFFRKLDSKFLYMLTTLNEY